MMLLRLVIGLHFALPLRTAFLLSQPTPNRNGLTMDDSEVWWKREERAIKCEKAGNIDQAVKLYEQNVSDHANTPHSYRRLVILYKMLGRRSDEQRVAREALTVATELDGKERHFFLKRLRR